MTPALAAAIKKLASREGALQRAAAAEIHAFGRIPAEAALAPFLSDREFRVLVGEPRLAVTVGVAVGPAAFDEIREAHGSPRLAEVPPEEDAMEFELHFAGPLALDILTTREPQGTGAIARFLQKFGPGIQQVEFKCADVDRATSILKEKFGVRPVYPVTRPGADGTRVNFFLLAAPERGKILIELYEEARPSAG